MPAIIPGTPLHSLLDALRKPFADVVSQALGANWSVAIDTADEASPETPNALHFRASISGHLQGGAALQVAAADALRWAQTLRAESVDPSAELNQEQKEALLELLRRVAGMASTQLSHLFGETTVDVDLAEPIAWEGVDVSILASEAAFGSSRLRLRLSSELLASVSSTSRTPSPPATVTDNPGAAISPEPNFDLLLGVHLNLTLRFGQRVMTLREILDLASGSVIELDREVQEPADLLLGDKLIARGEVVIVDGNYGIRITEVPDSRQRMGTS